MKLVLGTLNGELLFNLANGAAPFCTSVDAAVAYATGVDHPLFKICKEKALRITFYGLLDEEGAVSPVLLKELLAWGPLRAEARLVKGHFHPKVIWWRGYGAYIGSANLTHKAWFNNVEAGVFFTEAELASSGASDELDRLFDHLAANSIPVTTEIVERLELLGRVRHTLLQQNAPEVTAKFGSLFGALPENPGLTVVPPTGQKENRALWRFTTEWMETLQLMRGLAGAFATLSLRPTWVADDVHPTIHFDQFLHAYYYDYIRAVAVEDEENELSGIARIEEFFTRHRENPKGALIEAARWWAALPTAPHGEEAFIRETAPWMKAALSRDAVRSMDLAKFREALGNVNTFRTHARQVKNVEFGLPRDHHESIDQRVIRLCNWLWEQTTAGGKTIRDTLEFVLWGTAPKDMEQRLWLAISDETYRFAHFGRSILGETVGWARPDDYPPRNNRTNKALRALGHDVKLFSSS